MTLLLWGQGEVRRGFLFVFNDFRGQDFGSRGQAATGHLPRIAHQFVEVDLWSRNECADALARSTMPSRSSEVSAWRAVIRLTW